jgi:hypothetical protein
LFTITFLLFALKHFITKKKIRAERINVPVAVAATAVTILLLEEDFVDDGDAIGACDDDGGGDDSCGFEGCVGFGCS